MVFIEFQRSLPQPNQTYPLELSAQFEKGTLSGAVADREIQLDTRKIKLSDCSRIQLQPKPIVVLRDGTTLEGRAVGLSKVAFQIGGQIVTLDLSAATLLSVKTSSVGVVECTVIARQDGKEIGQSSTRIAVRGTRSEGWIELGDQYPFPITFQPQKYSRKTAKGIKTDGRYYLRTCSGDFLKKDFKFEIVYSLGSVTADDMMFFGIGQGEGIGKFNEPKNSIFMAIHPPNIEGGKVRFGTKFPGINIGAISSQDNHRVVIEKLGDKAIRN